MRKAIATAFIATCLVLACGQTNAQHYGEQPAYELSYVVGEEGLQPEIDAEPEPDSPLVAGPESETSIVDAVSLDFTGEAAAVAGSEACTESETEDDRPVLSGVLTREVDLLAEPSAGGTDPLPRPDGDELGAVLDWSEQTDVAEEACYVRVMSNGMASVREVRSLDLGPGRNSLRLENIPVSIIEDSVFLSVWHPTSDVTVRSHRLIRSDESAELFVEVSSTDQVLGASLEAVYLTNDLRAALSYSGMYDPEAASLRLAEWLTVDNGCGKDFDGAVFSFHLSHLGFEHRISSAVTLPAGEKSRFLCSDHLLSPASTIVTAENGPNQEAYEITELIKVEGTRDQGLLIPSSLVTIYTMDEDGFGSLVADGKIYKPKEYSWFTVETLDRPEVEVQRAKTGDEITGTGGIRDVSYRINIDNHSAEKAIVTIYEWMGPGNWFIASATVDANPISHSRDLSRREYVTFTVEVGPDSSRALFYKARIPER